MTMEMRMRMKTINSNNSSTRINKLKSSVNPQNHSLSSLVKIAQMFTLLRTSKLTILRMNLT
jgi:hypothetical protein